MTYSEGNATTLEGIVQALSREGFDALPDAMACMLNLAMEAERARFLGAQPYERVEDRRAYANGFKPRTLRTPHGALELRVPQVRRKAGDPVTFRPSALELGERSERALKLALAEMWVKGVSTRKVKSVLEELCGLEVSSSQVSRAAQLLDEELDKWRTRELEEVRYLVLDALYHKVRHGGRVVSEATLIATGVLPSGQRTVLGVSVALSEAEVHWRDFLASLQDRGMHGVRYVVSDDHTGLKAALEARLAGVPWNRCHFHLQQNAGAHVPRVEMRREVAEDLRQILNAADEPEARAKLRIKIDKYRETAPKLAEWMEANVPEGFAVFQLPLAHRKRLRTTNALENLNRQIRRRTRVATVFPSEGALLRLVTAILVETAEDWENGKIYLNMKQS